MKKFWLKTMAIVIIISMLLSVNTFAHSLEYIDVVLNSGDVVEEEQYYVGRSEENHPNYDPNFKDVNKVTFNAFGSEPIIVKAFGFAGWSAPVSVNEIVFNGTGDIILGSMAFAITNITELNLPSNIKFEDGACEVFYESKVKNVTIGCSMCEGMFYGCGFLETVTFTADNDISEIPKSAFDITRIEKIEIPSSVKKIGDSAFASSIISCETAVPAFSYIYVTASPPANLIMAKDKNVIPIRIGINCNKRLKIYFTIAVLFLSLNTIQKYCTCL